MNESEYCLDEYVSLGEKFRDQKVSNQCPNCGIEMGDKLSYLLKADGKQWYVCDLSCGVVLFKRQCRGAKGIASSIEVFDPRRRK